MNTHEMIQTFDNILSNNELDRLNMCQVEILHWKNWLYVICSKSFGNDSHADIRGIETIDRLSPVLYQYYSTNRLTMNKFIEDFISLWTTCALGDRCSSVYKQSLMKLNWSYKKIDRIILTDKQLDRNFLIDQLEKNREFINKLNIDYCIMRYLEKLDKEQQLKLIGEM